jgi:F-type H+-transporting ATPase subunit gamma
MEAVLANLSRAAAGKPSAPRLLRGTGSDETHLLVVATAERGLCGAFNSSIVRRARADINQLTREGKTVKILTIGKKGREQLRRDHRDKFVHHVDLSHVKRLGFDNARDVADEVLRRFDEGEFDVATLYFARFQTVLTQVPTAQQLIPAVFEQAEDTGGTIYEYEPEEEEILADLLPRNIATQIFTALLENAASEQGSRMTAMDSATRNAGEMIEKLTIVYNRTRQATITKELIEIISGAEAL